MSNKRSSDAAASTSSSPKKARTSTKSPAKPSSSFFAPRPKGAALPRLEPNELAGRLTPKKQGEGRKESTTLVTWNVCGMASLSKPEKRGAFRKYIEEEDADIVIITEVNDKHGKIRGSQDIDFLTPLYGKHRYFTKYVAVLSKIQPIAVTYGLRGLMEDEDLPDWLQSDHTMLLERTITLEFKACFVVGSYVKNSGTGFKNMDIKRAYLRDMKQYLFALERKGKSVIWGGDFNAIVDKMDIERSGQVWDREPGAHVDERALFGDIMYRGGLAARERETPRFPDVWRYLHPREIEYTHRNEYNGSWRLDSFLVSWDLIARVRKCEIRDAVRETFVVGQESGTAVSDHWPVWMEIAARTINGIDGEES